MVSSRNVGGPHPAQGIQSCWNELDSMFCGFQAIYHLIDLSDLLATSPSTEEDAVPSCMFSASLHGSSWTLLPFRPDNLCRRSSPSTGLSKTIDLRLLDLSQVHAIGAYEESSRCCPAMFERAAVFFISRKEFT